MELKIKIPNFNQALAPHMLTLAISLIAGTLAAYLTVSYLRMNDTASRIVTVDILAIEDSDEKELSDALRRNDNEKTRQIMANKLARSRQILAAIQQVATERNVVVILSQAVASGNVPDITQDVQQHLNAGNP